MDAGHRQRGRAGLGQRGIGEHAHGAVLHVDAAQAAGKTTVDVTVLGAETC